MPQRVAYDPGGYRADNQQPDHLEARREAAPVAPYRAQEVIKAAQDAAGDYDGQGKKEGLPPEDVHEHADYEHQRDEEDYAAHGGSAGLDLVPFGTFNTDVLAYAPVAQPVYDRFGQYQAQDECHRAQRQRPYHHRGRQ